MDATHTQQGGIARHELNAVDFVLDWLLGDDGEASGAFYFTHTGVDLIFQVDVQV